MLTSESGTPAFHPSLHDATYSKTYAVYGIPPTCCICVLSFKVDLVDHRLRTPLLLAVQGYPTMVRLLLDAGADLLAEDENGKSARMANQ